MKRLAVLIPAGAAIVVAVVIATSGGGSSAARGAADAQVGAPAAGATSVDLRRTALGSVLVDGRGQTLYLFEQDRSMTSTCTGACASVWPPLTAAGRLQAGPGLRASLLAGAPRPGGGTEVTYAGHPLYLYAGDTKPGDVRGQGLNQFGAKWYVLAASGRKIDTD